MFTKSKQQYRNYETVTNNYFCVRHKNKRKHNQDFKLLFFHDEFFHTLKNIKQNI